MLGELPVVVRFSEPSTGFARSNLTIVKGYATGMARLSDTVYGHPYYRVAACGGCKSCYLRFRLRC